MPLRKNMSPTNFSLLGREKWKMCRGKERSQINREEREVSARGSGEWGMQPLPSP